MRELTIDEIEQVSGGSSLGEFAAYGGAIGSIAWALVTNTMSGATRGGLGGALVGASFGAGYMVGSALYDYLS